MKTLISAKAIAGSNLTARFKSDQGPVWDGSATEHSFTSLGQTAHKGLKLALGAVIPLINKIPHEEELIHNVRLRKHGRLHLSVYYYESLTGKRFIEFKLGNDSMHDAIGFISGSFYLLLNGKPLGVYHKLKLPDQTGFATWIGSPFIAPDVAKMEEACQYYPKNVNLEDEILYWWGRHIDPRGEDHWNSTHTTGSPRNKYHPESLYAVWHFWNRHHPQIDDLAPQCLQRVYEQIGSIFLDEDHNIAFDMGRPHRLVDYSCNELVNFEKDYAYESVTPTQASFSEGVIETHPQYESFGRRELPVVDKERPESEWAFARLTGFVYKNDPRITGSPNNGGDFEHFENNWLYSAAICTPSELAKQELWMLQSVFTERDLFQPGVFHSSRTTWFGTGLLRAYHALDKLEFLVRARACLEAYLDHSWLEKLELNQYLYKGSTYDFVITRESRRSSYAFSTQGPFIEACWQAAVAANFFASGFTLDPDVAWKERWKEALIQAAKCVSLCYVKDQGLAENYECHYPGPSGPDGKPTLSGEISYMGTRHWCADPVAFALHLTGDEESFGWVKNAWEYYKTRDRYPWFMAGTEYWVKWHLWCTTFLPSENLLTAFSDNDPYHR